MRARIVIRLNERPVRTSSLYPGHVFVIGRSAKADLQLVGLAVSRKHATLELCDDGTYVCDLGSGNGTTLNGERLSAHVRTPVPNRGVIRLSDYEIQVLTSAGNDAEITAEQLEVQTLVLDKRIEVRFMIAKGAAGSVWAGWHEPLKRMVAIKVLLAISDDESRERFTQEARVIARVNSPYVVKLFDVSAKGARPYLLMEMVPGITAHERLLQEPMTIAETIAIGADIAQALLALGAAAVVHRDVKPDNVLLAPNGVAKLTDFGIAKDLESAGKLTHAGRGLGSFCYMAPEQFCNAKGVDASADLYGLGATLYHLLSGSPPFVYSGRGSPTQAIERIINEPPRPLRETSHGLAIPPALGSLIQGLLEKEPPNRPPARDTLAVLSCLRATMQAEPDRSMDTTLSG